MPFDIAQEDSRTVGIGPERILKLRVYQKLALTFILLPEYFVF